MVICKASQTRLARMWSAMTQATTRRLASP